VLRPAAAAGQNARATDCRNELAVDLMPARGSKAVSYRLNDPADRG